MGKIINKLNSFSEKRVSLLSLVGSFLLLLAIRVFIEHFLARSPLVSLFEILIEYIHDLYFFSLVFLLLWIFLSLLLKVNPKKLSYFFLFGFFLTIFPPLFDMLKTGGAVFWSFYILASPRDLFQIFTSFFGHLPSGIVYFGTKIVFSFSILLIGFLTYIKTKSFIKTTLGAIFSYFIFFTMGAFPTLFFFLYNFFTGTYDFSSIRAYHIAQFFGSPTSIFGVSPQVVKYTFVYNLNFIFFPFLILLLSILFFMIDRKKLTAVLKNSRIPQLIYHSGMFFIGIGLGALAFPQNLNFNIFSVFATFTLLICVWLSWLASVVANDIYDCEIDEISNPVRPLPQKIFTLTEYIHLGIFFFILALIGAASVSLFFTALIFVYQALAWIYSSPPYRLKKFPGVATFLSALATILILFMGYVLLSPDQTIYSLSWRIIFLILITFTISLPIKDFKDIAGDKKYGVLTIPVLFGEKKARLFVAINIFISYILSVFLLNELRLFWWAILFATITFLVLINEKINPRALPGWTLGIVSIYTLILTWIVFL